MVNLTYPSYTPRLLRGDEPGPEMLPVVSPQGIVIAHASRPFCHGGTKPLHPVVHLHIINRYGDVFLQHRAADKLVCPSMWDTAVGGHVTYGEMLEEALHREANEELGLYDFNPIFLESYVFESRLEKELVNVFAAVGNFDLHPCNEEVPEGRYWSMTEIDKVYGKRVLTPNFELEFEKIRTKLLALL